MGKKYKYFIVLLLIVFSLIAFGRILGNDFIYYDDNRLITGNINVQTGFNAESIRWAFTNSRLEYWHPLTWLSIILDWRLFGANAAGHHLVSLLWHIGSAILLFLFLIKTTGSLWPSAFVAALFALHPLRVESVAWAAERKDVLSVFFGMATLYAYAYYVEKPQITKYFICLMMFVLSLMSKPTLVTLPCVLLLLDYWPLGRLQNMLTPQSVPVLIDKKEVKKKSKKLKSESSVEKKIVKPVKNGHKLIGTLLWEKVPFFFLALVLSVMLILQLQEDRFMLSMQQITFSDRMVNAIVSYVAYLGKTFWPVDLAVFYPYINSFPTWQLLGASLLLVGISTAVIYLAKRAPFLAVGWLWYLGVLFPVIGLMQTGDQAMADRYTYFPSIGIAIMLTWGVVYLLPKENLRKIIIIPAAIILAVLTFLTWRQCGYWKNGITLFEHVLQATKDNYVAHNGLCISLAIEGQSEKAIAHCLAAIKINPSIEGMSNAGIALAAQGKYEEAIAYYLAAIKINPNDSDTHFNLAEALQMQGKVEEMIASYREALRVNPDHSSAHINLGVILGKQLKHDEALYHFREALRIDPGDPGIYFSLGVALANTGKVKEAEEIFRQAIYLKPDYVEARQALKMVQGMHQ
jgi:Flp pilus assembly protein TadD